MDEQHDIDSAFADVIDKLGERRKLSEFARLLSAHGLPVSRQNLANWRHTPGAHAAEKSFAVHEAAALLEPEASGDIEAQVRRFRNLLIMAPSDVKDLLSEALDASERALIIGDDVGRRQTRDILFKSATLALGDIQDVSGATITMTHIDGESLWSRLIEAVPEGGEIRAVSADDPLRYFTGRFVEPYLHACRAATQHARFMRLVVVPPTYKAPERDRLRDILSGHHRYGVHTHLVSDEFTGTQGTEFAVVGDRFSFEHAPEVVGYSRTVINFSRARIQERIRGFDRSQS